MAAPSKTLKRRSSGRVDVQRVCDALGKLAPLELAQSWDNVGLLAGDTTAKVERVMLCIDLMPEVVEEAVSAKVQMVMAYHPPIFKPVSRLIWPAAVPEAAVQRCIAGGIAVYSTHTALDAADGGTNDCLAQLCGIKETLPLEYAEVGPLEYKVVVFVPGAEAERVAEAMFAAGAGGIGDYQKCSFRTPGTGTFFGTKSAKPTIGQPGRLEQVDEIRLEMVCPAKCLSAVVDAMTCAHSYEEPAFDIHPRKNPPVGGIGRIGRLPKPMALAALTRKLKRATGAGCISMVGDPQRKVERAVVVVGAAGSLPFKTALGRHDVVITGEIRHHDALAIRRRDCSAIAMSHWSSERMALDPLAARLRALLPGVDVMLSEKDAEPFQRA
ncbi:MAG: Nif3-like dinuclear metal center hexameric protein [Phycisphaerae bacterium]|nr:Nif3-like dinuclear metal center hexameric protein [Phycisphaerae bacterium]